jgi:hypothetical protein
MTATDNAAIHYTLDGSLPTTASPLYTGPLSLANTTTLLYFAIEAGNAGDVQGGTYTIDQEPPLLDLSTLSNVQFTNNKTLNISGSVSDAGGVQGLFVNDALVPVATDGSFSLVLTLVTGANVVVTRATDNAGNSTSDSRTITLDEQAPALFVTAPSDNSRTASAEIDVIGTTEAESSIVVKVNEGNPATATINGSGFTYTASLALGLNTIEITATDQAGNKTTAKRSLIYDNLGPDLAIIDPNQDIHTSDETFLIRGTVSDSHGAVTLSIAVGSDLFTPLVTAGAFEQLLTFGAEKTYAVMVTAEDEAGNRATVQRNIIFDRTGSVLTIKPVQTPTNDRTQTITGTREAGDAVSISCPTAEVGPVVYPDAVTWSATLSSFALGVNEVTVIALDAAGNETEEKVLITVGNVYNGPKTVTLTVPAGMDIYYTTNGDDPAIESNKYTGPILLASSTVLKYFIADSLGNSGPVTTLIYTIDAEPPVLLLSTLSDGSVTNSETLNLAGKVTDNIGLKELAINGVRVSINGDGTFSHAITLPVGTTVITTEAVDIAGNLTTDIRTIVFDRETPVVTVTAPADNFKTQVSALQAAGSMNEPGFVDVFLNGEPWPVVMNGAGFTCDMELPAGISTVEIKAVDLAGNSSTVKRTVTYDGKAPTLAVLEPPADITVSLATVVIRGRVSDAMTAVTLEISVDNKTYAPAVEGNVFTQSLMLSGERTHSVVVTARDEAGNVAIVQRNIIYNKSVQGAVYGDLNADGLVEAADALVALRLAVGLEPATSELLGLGDVAPMRDGRPGQDGVIDVADALVILETAVGLHDVTGAQIE